MKCFHLLHYRSYFKICHNKMSLKSLHMRLWFQFMIRFQWIFLILWWDLSCYNISIYLHEFLEEMLLDRLYLIYEYQIRIRIKEPLLNLKCKFIWNVTNINVTFCTYVKMYLITYLVLSAPWNLYLSVKMVSEFYYVTVLYNIC